VPGLMRAAWIAAGAVAAAAVLEALRRSGGPLVLPGPGVGLGDVVKAGTAAAGVAPCPPCLERAARLNQLVRFGGQP
jgi:hypothetical protein